MRYSKRSLQNRNCETAFHCSNDVFMVAESPIVLQGDKGPHMQDSLRGREGMIQGSPEGPAAFAIAFNVELKLLAEELREAAKGTKWENDYPVVKAGADDTFVLGPIELILAPIARFKERIKGIGLELKLSRTEWHVRDPEARAKAAPNPSVKQRASVWGATKVRMDNPQTSMALESLYTGLRWEGMTTLPDTSTGSWKRWQGTWRV